MNDAAWAPGPIPGLDGKMEQEALASGENEREHGSCKYGRQSGARDRPAESW